ncbi:MAG: class II fructose-bisphosphate aldolase [bacterium]|nr:class II fructose-bisphosphate aldolase [bacterium]
MNAKEWLTKAKKEGFAIGAFNVGNLETLEAIVAAAKAKKAPVIIEASPGESSFMGYNNLVDLAQNYKDEGVAIILNLDHATEFEKVKQAFDAGFDYLHFDGGQLPFEENVAIAKQVVEMAHPKAVMVEGEVDHITGSSDLHTGEKVASEQVKGNYSDPQKAREFVERTGVDTYASFIGNAHGLYADEKRLDLNRLKEIRQVIPDTFLSLHGGSGVNQEDIKAAIEIGVNKINVNTEMRNAYRKELEELLRTSDEVAMYKLYPEIIEEVQKVVGEKIDLFGSAGKV